VQQAMLFVGPYSILQHHFPAAAGMMYMTYPMAIRPDALSAATRHAQMSDRRRFDAFPSR
jgi:hypothetical protein